MNNESCPVDGWHVTVQFSPSQSLSAEAFFSSTRFLSSRPSLTPRTHQACSEMLYFEERVQRETFKPIRPNHRPIFLLLFSPLNWGSLRIGAHPHPHGQSHLPGAQWGNTTTHAPATPLGTLPWSCGETVNRQPPVTSQPVRPT